jgi:hypothetical protein
MNIADNLRAFIDIGGRMNDGTNPAKLSNHGSGNTNTAREESVVGGQRSVVSGQRSVVRGRWSEVRGRCQ